MRAFIGGVTLMLALAACEPIRPTAGRYLCKREEPVETQCLAGWRCGLDNYCFDPSGAGPLPTVCADPATDCPEGWKCSVDRTCFDPTKPTAVSFPCRDPATDCPNDWKCGLDQRCLNPAEPGPWRCEDTARDCTGGWTCGATALCFDRADAGRVSCREGVATDCNDGWRCGIDGLCQQLDAGFPWPCRDDSHCEAQWRCGPAGTCLDPSGDALRPNSGSPMGARLGLRWPDRAPDEVALDDQPWNTICGFGNRYALHLSGAARFGRRVELFAVQSSGGAGLPTSCELGIASGDVPIIGSSVDFNEEPLAMVQNRDTTMVLVDGGVRSFMLEAAGQHREVPTVSGRFERLRLSRVGGASKGLAMNEREVTEVKLGGQSELLTRAPLVAVDGGPARIADAIIWPVHGANILVAATDQGLFSKDLALGVDGPWRQLQWSDPATAAKELRLAPQADGGTLLMARVEEPSTGTARIFIFGASNLVSALQDRVLGSPNTAPAMYVQPVMTAEDAGFHVLWQENYVSCARGMRGWYANFQGMAPSRGLAFLQCALSDGGTTLQRTTVNPFSSASPIALEDQETPLAADARWYPIDEGRLGMLDPAGGIYLAGMSPSGFVLQPWTTTSAPSAVAGRIDDRLLLRDERRDLTMGTSAPVAVVNEAHFVAAVDGGLLRVDSELGNPGQGYRLLASIDGRPDLMVVALPLGTSSAAVLVQADDGGFFGPSRQQAPVPAFSRGPTSTTRQLASAASSADGGSAWYLTYEDQLLFSQLGAPSPVDLEIIAYTTHVQRLPTMRLALTPLTGAPITHVRALPPDPSTGASFGQALVVAAGRLFHVRADNPVVWRASEPLSTGSEIVKTWADGARVRIGDREGRVLSYPSRVPISPRLPTGAQALDYVDVCGVTYALGRDGLWRLEATAASPIGTWVTVPLPSGFRFETEGLLHTDGTGLLAFDEQGRIANVTGLTCAQPL